MRESSGVSPRLRRARGARHGPCQRGAGSNTMSRSVSRSARRHARSKARTRTDRSSGSGAGASLHTTSPLTAAAWALWIIRAGRRWVGTASSSPMVACRYIGAAPCAMAPPRVCDTPAAAGGSRTPVHRHRSTYAITSTRAACPGTLPNAASRVTSVAPSASAKMRYSAS